MFVREQIRVLAPKWHVALLRVFAGAFYLRVATARALALQADASVLKAKLVALEAAGQVPWFSAYLARVVDPVRDTVFLPMLWVAAPLLLGLSLVLGLFTRLSAALGAILIAHVWLLRYSSAGATDLRFLELQFAVLATLCFAAAGRAFGIDAVFWKHRMFSTRGRECDPRKVEPRVPIIKDIPPIPLSERKPTGRIDSKPDDA